MPRTASQLQQVRDERQSALLDAARKVFIRKGYANTRMADVAAEARASYGLLYHYFPTKEAVYLALVQHAARGAVRVTAAALERAGTPWTQLEWLTGEMLDGMQENLELPLLIAQAAAGEEIPPAARAEATRVSQASQTNVAALIRAGQAAGQVVAGDPDELAGTFLALIQGLGVKALVWPGTSGRFPSTATVLRLLRP